MVGIVRDWRYATNSSAPQLNSPVERGSQEEMREVHGSLHFMGIYTGHWTLMSVQRGRDSCFTAQ
jgi:hypothetical protein